MLSPEGNRESSDREGPLDSLSILYVFDEQKLRFQFVTENPPFCRSRKPLLSGWVDGWMGDDQQFPSISLIFKYINKQDLLILNMVSKVLKYFCIGLKIWFEVGG